MPASQKKVVVNKFPLRLMPSVRRVAENFSQKEGVSLNQFINIAVAEKLAHLQHEEWLAHRPKPSGALIAKALTSLTVQQAMRQKNRTKSRQRMYRRAASFQRREQMAAARDNPVRLERSHRNQRPRPISCPMLTSWRGTGGSTLWTGAC